MKKLSIIIIFLSLFTIPILNAQVNLQDSLALVSLFDSCGGKHWFKHDNWLTKAPVRTWFGIGVNTSNRIDSITLNNIGITGYIPSAIGNLAELRILVLSSNQLSGSIPSSFSNLTKLITLALDYNYHLTGTLPSYLVNFINLQSLDLEYNQLSGSIPNSLGNLTKMNLLRLDNNQLTGIIPPSLGNLINLTDLELYNNQLTGSIPTSLGNLTNLIYLYLFENQLSGAIPDSLGNLNHVIHISINNNQLSGSIPSSLSNLPKLQALGLNNNHLSGSIPSSWKNYSNFIKSSINIVSNRFTFAGTEAIGAMSAFSGYYAPQATVPLIQSGNTLSVSVGGTPTNDTYKWYNNGTLVATKVADSTFTPTTSGKYWVVATNSIATQLTLYSDTLNITVLPIKDIALSAKETNGQVLLQWQTIGEFNSLSFIIQYSTDGSSFTDLASQKAVGSGNNGYSYKDASAANGINYYRIKSVDKEGNISFSNVSLLTTNHLPLTTFTVYPNPVTGNSFNLQLGDAPIGKYNIRLVNTLGQTVYSKTLEHAVSNALETVTISKKLVTGNYFFSAIDANGDILKTTINIE